MKKIAILVAVMMLVAMVGSAMALSKGEKVYETKMGKVTFSIDTHKAAGNKCGDCHPKVWAMKAGEGKNPAPHKAGENCGVCHDGTKAPNKCDNCHKK